MLMTGRAAITSKMKALLSTKLFKLFGNSVFF